MAIGRREAIKLGLLGAGQLLVGPALPAQADCKANLAMNDLPPPSAPCLPKQAIIPANTPIPACPSPTSIQPFQREYQIPKLCQPLCSDERGERPTDYYQLTLRKGQLEILPGKPTEIWGYDGMTPGPLIRQRGGLAPENQGRQSVVRFINELGEDAQGKPIHSNIHLHGMPSLPEYDGYAEDLIPPGYFKDYIYPNSGAGTLWYHDHTIGKTSRNVYQGLAGMYLVEDEIERQLNLPRGENFEYDIPLVLQDFRLDQDGQLVFNDRAQRNLFGDVPLVNGVPWPFMQVERRKYRFRVLNASASRTYQLSLSRQEDRQTYDDTLSVIATDCGLITAPVPIRSSRKTPFRSFRIAPAERYEFVIDFSQYEPNTSVYLRNAPLQSNIDTHVPTPNLMRFDILLGQPKDTSELRRILRPVVSLEERARQQGKSIRTRTFRFERSNNQWVINNKTWNPNYIEANPEPGDVEIWELVNPGGGWTHPVHIHLVEAQILSRNGRSAFDYEQGWKDVFLLHEWETVRVIMQFETRNTDNPRKGLYMMHCHNLVHEDHDMMTQFEIGQGAPSPCSQPAQPIASMKPLC
jgi:spore coat protein A, manganese oxidase